jgi:hypothetical protein
MDFKQIKLIEKKMNTQENNNRLIAEFMGLELEENLEGLFVYARKEQSPIKLNDIRTEFYEAHELQYHTSWDWLMPVIDKCYQEHMSKHIAEAVMTCDIDNTYKVLVEFINWWCCENN